MLSPFRPRFVAETLTADAKAYRGRAVWLSGPARDLSAGKVALPVAGGVHALHPATVTITHNEFCRHVHFA